MGDIELPKDLEFKIGSKEQAGWKNVLKQAQDLVIKGTQDLEINEMIVELAEKRVAEEIEKFK